MVKHLTSCKILNDSIGGTVMSYVFILNPLLFNSFDDLSDLIKY